MSLDFYNLTNKDNINIKYHDFYFSDQYGFCVEQSDHAQWEIAVWNNGRIIYPYLKRPYIYQDITYYDLISPYGYSGFDIDESVTKEEFLFFSENIFRKSY